MWRGRQGCWPALSSWQAAPRELLPAGTGCCCRRARVVKRSTLAPHGLPVSALAEQLPQCLSSVSGMGWILGLFLCPGQRDPSLVSFAASDREGSLDTSYCACHRLPSTSSVVINQPVNHLAEAGALQPQAAVQPDCVCRALT